MSCLTSSQHLASHLLSPFHSCVPREGPPFSLEARLGAPVNVCSGGLKVNFIQFQSFSPLASSFTVTESVLFLTKSLRALRTSAATLHLRRFISHYVGPPPRPFKVLDLHQTHTAVTWKINTCLGWVGILHPLHILFTCPLPYAVTNKVQILFFVLYCRFSGIWCFTFSDNFLLLLPTFVHKCLSIGKTFLRYTF